MFKRLIIEYQPDADWGNNNTFNLDTNTDITASMGRATGKQRMAARSRRVLKSLPTATQRELHAIHEVRSLTDTDNIPPSVLGNLLVRSTATSSCL